MRGDQEGIQRKGSKRVEGKEGKEGGRNVTKNSAKQRTANEERRTKRKETKELGVPSKNEKKLGGEERRRR